MTPHDHTTAAANGGDEQQCQGSRAQRGPGTRP
jgi:hypothetical protein